MDEQPAGVIVVGVDGWTGSGARRGAGAGRRLRGLPHRPAPGRRRARPRARAGSPGTRWSAWSTRSAPGATGFAARATASASPGCAAPAARAAAAAAAREPVPALALHRLGRRRRLRRVRRRPGGLRLPPAGRASTTRRPRRCCAPGSSATGRCAGRELPPGGRLGIYGFGASAHLTAQVAIAQGAEVHVLTRAPAARALALALGAASVRARTTDRRPSRSTRRSCSPRSATWSRWRWRPWTAAGRWRWPASTSPTSRRWTTSATCSTSGSCTASPPTPGPTARSSCALAAAAAACGRRSRRTRSTDADRALADLAAGRVTGAAVVVV